MLLFMYIILHNYINVWCPLHS